MCADCAYAGQNLPRLIALCGNPHAGKSEVQRILSEHHGYTPGDDGWPLRDFAIRHFGLTLEDVTTQAGKDSYTAVMGVRYQNRDILGRIGNSIEAPFGADILPWLAVQGLDANKRYSFGSVRRRQGKVYKALGGVVIGIRRPGVGPSAFEFDRFDETLVDVWIDNDGTVEHLVQKVAWAVQAVSLMQHAA